MVAGEGTRIFVVKLAFLSQVELGSRKALVGKGTAKSLSKKQYGMTRNYGQVLWSTKDKSESV